MGSACGGARRGVLQLAHASARAPTHVEATKQFLRLIRRVEAKVSHDVQNTFGRRVSSEFEASLITAAPMLARAGGRVARSIFRDRRVRHCIKFLPQIVHRSLIGVARLLSQGKAVSPAKSVRIFARQCRICLRSELLETLNGGGRRVYESEWEAGPASCLQDCETKFQSCLNPPWWKPWITPNPNQCLAERQACQRGCQPPTAAGCGKGICEGPNCAACCQFMCPNNLSECMRLCSPYR